MGLSWLRAARDGVELLVHVQPGAAVLGVCGTHGDALKIRIRARAVEGAANAALTDYLAILLGLSRGEVRILRGEKSRRKMIWVALPPDQVEQRLMGTTV
jgi:uncharacterized protein